MNPPTRQILSCSFWKTNPTPKKKHLNNGTSRPIPSCETRPPSHPSNPSMFIWQKSIHPHVLGLGIPKKKNFICQWHPGKGYNAKIFPLLCTIHPTGQLPLAKCSLLKNLIPPTTQPGVTIFSPTQAETNTQPKDQWNKQSIWMFPKIVVPPNHPF